MDSKGLNDIDRVDEAMSVDVHAEAGQVPGVAQCAKLFMT